MNQTKKFNKDKNLKKKSSYFDLYFLSLVNFQKIFTILFYILDFFRRDEAIIQKKKSIQN